MLRIRTSIPAMVGAWLALVAGHGLAWAQSAPASEAAQVRRSVELRESPAESAHSLGTLAAQTAVTRTGRQGGWVQVRTAQGATGWLALYDVMGTGAGAGAASGSAPAGSSLVGGLRSLTGMLGGGQTTTTASLSGIRGLTEEDIARAAPNPAALAQAESMRADAGAARQFAAAAPLASRAVDPLPEPPRPAADSSAPREAP
ncbi:MAG: SH3 domain-containing protein [Pseudomonadota bacterium]